MGLFGNQNPFDADVEKATDEKNTGEDWAKILDICDKATQSKTGPKDCLKSIMTRVSNRNPRIALQAITLMDACVKNCGKGFHLEVASRETVAAIRELITAKGHDRVAEKLFDALKKWSENEFKTDPSLDLIPSLYRKLRSEGFDFSDSEAAIKREHAKKKDEAAKEEEDIMMAIAMSLQEQGKQKEQKSSSLYPTFTGSSVGGSSSSGPASSTTHRKVRALYDFEAAEDNELTFHTGDLITVTDDSDVNWWRGSTETDEGLFPANFVTADLSAPAESNERKGVSFNEEVEVKQLDEPAEVCIDEGKMDECLELLQNADPSGEQRPDPPEMQQLEDQCKAMGPLIDQELDKVDRGYAAMMEVNVQVDAAVQLYNELMALPASLQKPAGQPMYGMMPTPGVPNPQPSTYYSPQQQDNMSMNHTMNQMPSSLPHQYQQYDSLQSIQSIPASAASSFTQNNVTTPNAAPYNTTTPNAAPYNNSTPSAAPYNSLTPSAAPYNSLTPSATPYNTTTPNASPYNSSTVTSNQMTAPQAPGTLQTATAPAGATSYNGAIHTPGPGYSGPAGSYTGGPNTGPATNYSGPYTGPAPASFNQQMAPPLGYQQPQQQPLL